VSRDQLRSSQVVLTFGPGSMVDLPEASTLIASLEHWRYDIDRIPVITEPRLAAKVAEKLQRSSVSLRSPPPAPDNPAARRTDVTAWRFPEWFIVQHAVQVGSFRRRQLVHADRLQNGRFRGIDRNHDVVPVRFVRACKKGHIGDIDWRALVHGGKTDCRRDLWLEERGTTGDLGDIHVLCECGKSQPMSQAARMELKLLGHCDGNRPWLGPGKRESCAELNRLLIRSASNAYFPQILSVISIPDMRSPVDDVVNVLWEDFLIDVETPEELAKVRGKRTPSERLAGLDDAAILASIRRKRQGGSDDRKIKEVEFEALAEAKDELGSDQPGGDFFARALPEFSWRSADTANIERVVLVHRLREVMAQVGFTRFEASGPDTSGELDLDVESAPLALDSSWVPAVENRGEGLFLQFDTQAIDDWVKRPKVAARGEALLAGFTLWQRDHPQSKRVFPGLPYVLLHSLSHLLMTAMSLECGYPASSLRERVYAMPGRYGVLIYTGSSDSEGTLGGLIQAGRDLRRHMRRALELGALCSNDPICAYHRPANHNHQMLNGAACHGCMLVAETSCEQRNEFLDRALVVPTVEALGCEFFPA
jgi:hypothetical protein